MTKRLHSPPCFLAVMNLATCLQPGEINGHVLVDVQGLSDRPPRDDGQEPIPLLVGGECFLLPGRGQPLLIGQKPDLQKVDGLFHRGVVFRVKDARSRRHPLELSGMEQSPVAQAVPVFQGAVDHIGHDFHVGVRMFAESSTRLNGVVVEHPQGRTGCCWDLVFAEGKAVVGDKPAVVRPVSLLEGMIRITGNMFSFPPRYITGGLMRS